MINVLAAFTVIVLHHQGKYLLLERAPTKKLFPNLWTGVGGKVELDEMRDLRASAYRELLEETGVAATDVENFVLRRVLFHARDDLTALLYYTADLKTYVLPHCPEGALRWVAPADFAQIEFIESAGAAIPLLALDHQRDPQGLEPLKMGLAFYDGNKMRKAVWGEE